MIIAIGSGGLLNDVSVPMGGCVNESRRPRSGRNSKRISVGSIVVVLVLAIASLKPADATIQCQGNFQVTKYRLIDTPYCEEEQIAIVAQGQGWHVSASEIHNNPLKKIEVCTALAGDARLKGSCPVRAKRGG